MSWWDCAEDSPGENSGWRELCQAEGEQSSQRGRAEEGAAFLGYGSRSSNLDLDANFPMLPDDIWTNYRPELRYTGLSKQEAVHRQCEAPVSAHSFALSLLVLLGNPRAESWWVQIILAKHKPAVRCSSVSSGSLLQQTGAQHAVIRS